MYTGHNCEKDVSECPSGGPLVCEHYCRPLPESYRCLCARGYNLHSDGRSCIPWGLQHTHSVLGFRA
ncbi:hypothetical protein PDJAM_G00158150 [Pangasius djambal]|uniref:Uncharacterized protein n=1 Tax=Pangasius djambal TaxID=1691987 RepID=A0ACC5ZI50_9TELE|nr:hypothetical protein [Pangasius djambal]